MLKDLDPKEVHDHFEEIEATFLHLYLDSKGFPTVGRGCLVTEPFQPLDYGEWVDMGGHQARVADVIDDLHSIMRDARHQKESPNAQDHTAEYYEKMCHTRLTMESADLLFWSRLYKIESRLISLYRASYETAPLSVQFATLDMAYNMGPDKLREPADTGGYPAWSAAFEKRDYLRCAAESAREPGNASFIARNKWTFDKFMEAAKI